MGEVRKRNGTAEKSQVAEKPVVTKSGGLGFISVVLISTILAGSGCFVIKKDNAEIFANINTLTDQLKADVARQDSIIKELQSKVTGNAKTQTQIDTLEVAVQETKKSGAAQTSELKKLIEDNTANTAALEMQAAQLGEVNGQIDGLNVKFDGAAAQINAETVAIHAKIENVETANAAAINEIKTIELVELKATVSTVQAQIELFAETIDEVSSSIPSQTTLLTLQTTTKKASDGLTQALKEIHDNSHGLRAIRTEAEKELAALAARIGGIVDDVKQGDTVAKTLNENIESANQIIGALTSDIEGLKKRHSELSKKMTAK